MKENKMKEINFLTGSLAYREHKTGVHFFHDMLIKETIDHGQYEVSVSFYDKRKNVEHFLPRDVVDKGELKYSSKLTRVLSYLLPVSLFFGKADIYICDGLIPITSKGSKRVAIIFDLMVKVFPEYYGNIKKVYLNYFFHRCKKADLIITISETTKRDIIKYLSIDEEKIHVVPCGYEENYEGTISQEIKNVVKDNYLFYVGDMRKNKNLMNAIKGFELASKQDKDLKFYIAGKKSAEYERLLAYVKDHCLQEKVIFLGYISNAEKAELYKNSLALLFVSEYEGFGIPILEAANYQVPVITSDCSSMREIAEGFAITVDPKNPDSISDAIHNVRDSVYRNRIIEQQKKLLDVYTWKNMYSSFEKAIQSIK